jgi:hypothetical protein
MTAHLCGGSEFSDSPTALGIAEQNAQHLCRLGLEERLQFAASDRGFALDAALNIYAVEYQCVFH